jgi:serine phosphatase RsbU (regulator of sigma subunit)
MRKAVWVLFALCPVAAPAQSIITIAPQQCVWHAGDNLAWSASKLDESDWQPYSELKWLNAPQRYWVRCHADLSSLGGNAHSAIQMSFYAALQVFANGYSVGSAGDLRNGSFDMNVIRTFPLPQPTLNPPPATIAIRTAYPKWAPSVFRLLSVLPQPQLKVDAGEAETIHMSYSDQLLARISRNLPIAALFEVPGVVAIMLLGLWFYDRSRNELLLLGLTCLCLAVLRLNEFCAEILLRYPFKAFVAAYLAGNLVAPIVQTLFFFTLARRRMPILYWIFVGYTVLEFLMQTVELSLGISVPAWQGPLIQNLQPGLVQIARLTAPWVAFWPLSRIPFRMRPVACVCILWSTVDMLWFAIQTTSTSLTIPWVPKIYTLWRGDLLEIRAIATVLLLVALLALLFREQREVTEERAVFAGEVQAARSVQQYLIPAHMPATPGFAIESQYHPAREVGGDFFQVLPQTADGSLLIVIGDVAGKGVEAGMLATLIVGAIRTAAAFTTDPERILALLNMRLSGRGLATCLALSIDKDGSAALVNAGHLPPYLNGKELTMEGALPLGAVPGISFPVSRFQLVEGDSLVLMTDGVAESQNVQGELFGFERIDALLHSGTAGAALAEAAQQFGQQDDITILTLTRLKTGEPSSAELATPALAPT